MSAADVAPPAFDPGEGDSAVTFPVTITCATPGAVIRYTLNGSEPVPSDPAIASGAAITIARNLTLKAKAWSAGETSTTTEATYRLTGDVAAGAHHVLTLSADGAVHAWGEQSSGRLGNGLTATANVPTPGPAKYAAFSPVTDAIALGAGQNHSLFIQQDGSVWSFGNNASGELGDTTTQNRPYAVSVKANDAGTTSLTGCVMVRAGNNSSGALGANGQVYMWGSQASGKLGNGSTLGNKKYAVNVLRGDLAGNPVLDGIVQFSIGSASALAREACSLESAGALGRVWAWGNGGSGRLGLGSTSNEKYAYPVKLNSTTVLEDAWYASAGESHGVVVRRKDGAPALNGSVWTFGNGSDGRLGNNSTSNALYPVQVINDDTGTPLDNVRMVAAGSAHTLALTYDGKVLAWGENGYGAIGDGTTVDRLKAVKVKNPDGTGQLGDAAEGEIVWIAAGGDGSNNTSYAISASGKVFGWGRNDDGELGTGSTSSGATSLPLEVPGFQVVPGYPEVSLAHTVDQSAAPGSVTLTASPTDPDGPGNLQKVEFYSQGALVGQATASPWQLVLSDLEVGDYHVYAVVTDMDGHQGQSAPVSFSIATPHPDSDLDEDGLTYATELALGTDPWDPDHDNDGMGDGYEAYYSLDPLSGANGQGANASPTEDKDDDGIPNRDESVRGSIPVSGTESPAITGTFPDSHAKWFGVEGVTYHFEYSSDQSNWSRHPQPLAGGNSEITLQISTVVATLPDPFHTRLVAESDAPNISLAIDVTDYLAPGAATLTATPVDSDGPGDVASVQFWLNGVSLGSRTAAPWTFAISNLAAGTHEARAIVTDLSGKRGFTGWVPFAVLSPDPNADSDLDGLPDGWEMEHFGALEWNASDDVDGDGLTNAAELTAATYPNDPDTDGDSMGDGFELYYGLDALATVNGEPAKSGPDDDKDEDGMENKDEYDRGLIPISPTESPAITGTFPNSHARWFGVSGVTYHFEHSTDQTNWTRHPTPLEGTNAEIVLAISSVVGSLPDPFFTRLVTESDAPEVTLSAIVTNSVAPGAVTLTANPADPDGAGDIARVEFYLDGNYKGFKTASPWTLVINQLDEGSHTVNAIVIDLAEKRGFSNQIGFSITAPEPSSDTDGDGLPDSWEMEHFGSLDRNGTADFDGDGLTDLQEFQNGTRPAEADSDGDGVSDAGELAAGTSPHDADTDNDGIPDGEDPDPLVPATVSLAAATTLMVWSPAE